MFPLQSHVTSLVIELQAISVNIMARWIVFRYFTLSLHFTPGLQSAVCILPLVCNLPPVCSLQSAVRSLRFTLTELACEQTLAFGGQLDFGCMKRFDFWRAKRAENFPHNPTCFPHNLLFFSAPYQMPWLNGNGKLKFNKWDYKLQTK